MNATVRSILFEEPPLRNFAAEFTLAELIRQAQFEEPVCSSALSETLSTAYELINEVYNYLAGTNVNARRSEAENA